MNKDQIAMHGFISLNLFLVCPPHSFCHLFLMNEATAFDIEEFNGLQVYLAALSATVSYRNATLNFLSRSDK